MIGTRNNRTKLVRILGIGGLALFGATACNVSFSLGAEGSGIPETVTYDVESFDEVDLSNSFNGEITVVEGPPSVEVTVDDNLVEKLRVEVDGDELNVDIKGNSIDFGVVPTVIISMPNITELDLSGGSSAVVTGVDTPSFKVDLSGGSDAEVDGAVENLVIDGSGGASLIFNGSADRAVLDLSGAASADLSDAVVESASVDLSGASDVLFETIDEVTGDLSGAATVRVPNGTNVTVDTSGGASVDRY